MGSLDGVSRAICSGEDVGTGEITSDLAGMINDDLEAGETALLSRVEVSEYLAVHQAGGLAVLEDMAKFGLSGCTGIRAPLFDADVKKEVLKLAQKLTDGALIDFHAQFSAAKWDDKVAGAASRPFVEALAATVSYESAIDPLANKLDAKADASSVQGRILYDPNTFVPPQAMVPEELSGSVVREWRAIAQIALQEAWKHVFGLTSTEDLNESPFLKALRSDYPKYKMRLGTSVGRQVVLYIDVDAAQNDEENDVIKSDLKTIYERVQKAVAESLGKIMKNRSRVQIFMRAADLMVDLDIGLALQSQIEFYDRMRARTEPPEDRRAFLHDMQLQIAKMAESDPDFADVNVELLKSEDWAMGYVGLYIPASKPGEKSTVRVPMSYYTCEKYLERDQALRILAHELAHHKMRKISERSAGKLGTVRSHSWDHTKLEDEIYARLRSISAAPAPIADRPPDPVKKEEERLELPVPAREENSSDRELF